MKAIIDRVVERAISDINRKELEAKLPDHLRRIQEGFRNSQLLAGNEALAELTGLITGFRPRTSTTKVAPFEVFEVLSKAEQRVVKTAMCISVINGQPYGVTNLNEAALLYAAESCQLADEGSAQKFIKEEVSTWDDGALIGWISKNIGHQQISQLYAELDRSSLASAVASASKK